MNARIRDPQTFRRVVNGHARWLRWKNRWPALVWAGGCLTAAGLYLSDPTQGGFSMRGMVEADAVSVAPVEAARVKSIRVTEGQAVKAGDVLVEMDTALIEHGVAADQIDIVRIETAFGDTHQDVLQAVSQRRDAIAAVETDIATCRQEWEREKSELAALRQEQARRDGLRKRSLIEEMVRTELLPEIANLEKAVEQYPVRMATLEKQLDEARTYHDHIMAWLGAKGDEPISIAIQRRMNEGEVGRLLRTAGNLAELHRQAYILRAPRDGLVSSIAFKPGDVVLAGVPILRVVSKSPNFITAFLSEADAAALQVGATVKAQSATRPSCALVQTVVVTLGPEIHVAGYELSFTGREVPVRARKARLSIQDSHELIAGESVWLQPENASVLGRMRSRFGSRQD